MSYKFNLYKEEICLKFLKGKSLIKNYSLGRKIVLLQSNVEVRHIAHFKAVVSPILSKDLCSKKTLSYYFLYCLKITPVFFFIVKSFKHTNRKKQDNNHLTITYVQKLFSHFSELFQSKSQSFILPPVPQHQSIHLLFFNLVHFGKSKLAKEISYSKASVNQKEHLQINSNLSFWEQTRNVYSFNFFSLSNYWLFQPDTKNSKMFNLFPEKSIEN